MIKKLLVGAMASVSMVACGSVSSTGDVDVKAEAVIIDVRSPSEFAEGHVDGAINLDPIWSIRLQKLHLQDPN